MNVTHGLTLANIRSVSCLIRRDDDAIYTSFPTFEVNGVSQEQITINATVVSLNRATSGVFDTTDYNDPSFNRGWITIIYA